MKDVAINVFAAIGIACILSSAITVLLLVGSGYNRSRPTRTVCPDHVPAEWCET